MNDRLHARLGLLLGLIVAATAAVWWLGATRLAIEQSSSGAAAVAGSALAGLWLARAVILAPFALRAGALRGWWQGVAGSLAVVVAAWPVVLAATHAARAPVTAVLLGESALLLACGLLAAAGAALRVLLRPAGNALLVGTTLGGAIAAAAWIWGGAWTRMLS
jgi:hypothetical protein